MTIRPICLIPARAGSKGLPDKNMLFLDGKPMIFHTIDTAIESGCFAKEDIYVSTDSLLYKEVCEEKGINVILRSEHLATDMTTSYEVNADFLKDFSEDQVFVLLQVTSPLRGGVDIREALSLYDKSNADHLVSYTKADKSPELYVTVDDNGYIQGDFGVDKGYRRQDKQKYYVPNGAIFISRKGEYLRDQSYFTDRTYAYIMSKDKSMDIDDLYDFKSVMGLLYFDYSKRERQSKKYYQMMYTKLSKKTNHKLIIGDSRLVDFNLEGYTNLSIGGVTLHTFMENKDLFLTSYTQQVLVSIGINDIITEYSQESIKQQFFELINICRDLGIDVKLTSIPLTLFRTISNQKVIELNQYLKQLAMENHIDFLDVNQYVAKDNQLSYQYTSDGLHFNEIGQTLFFNTLEAFLV